MAAGHVGDGDDVERGLPDGSDVGDEELLGVDRLGERIDREDGSGARGGGDWERDAGRVPGAGHVFS